MSHYRHPLLRSTPFACAVYLIIIMKVKSGMIKVESRLNLMLRFRISLKIEIDTNIHKVHMQNRNLSFQLDLDLIDSCFCRKITKYGSLFKEKS